MIIELEFGQRRVLLTRLFMAGKVGSGNLLDDIVEIFSKSHDLTISGPVKSSGLHTQVCGSRWVLGFGA